MVRRQTQIHRTPLVKVFYDADCEFGGFISNTSLRILYLNNVPLKYRKMERPLVKYEDISDRFAKVDADFNRQYCSIYKLRLEKMRDLLMKRVKKKWGDSYPVIKVYKLAEENHPKCIVIGTLFKDQRLKPSILVQLSEANHMKPQPIRPHFSDPSDVLLIEDELQRYELIGPLNKDYLVSGISLALLVTDQKNGKLTVHDYCFAGFQPQIERPIPSEDYYVVFISGLDLINSANHSMPLQLFFDWIMGLMGDTYNIKVDNIVRLIIAGNSIQTKPPPTKLTISLTSRTSESNENIEAVQTLDSILHKLCQVLDVDLMPGEHDPSNYLIPQLPMHPCMFPKSILYKSMNLASNPYEFKLENTRILGTSGQPARNITWFSEITDCVDVLEKCLEWSHIAPTAPDTLGCFPFYSKDPFVLESCPHVFFSGNQEKFDTKLCYGEDGQCVRLISIPEFGETCTVCVLNLKNLECTPVSFKT